MTASQGELCNWSMHKSPGINAPTDIIYPPTRNHFSGEEFNLFLCLSDLLCVYIQCRRCLRADRIQFGTDKINLDDRLSPSSSWFSEIVFFLGFREQDICRDASASTEVIIGRDIAARPFSNVVNRRIN
jgi:hypothetical protein